MVTFCSRLVKVQYSQTFLQSSAEAFLKEIQTLLMKSISSEYMKHYIREYCKVARSDRHNWP